MVLCSGTVGYQCFGGPCCLHLHPEDPDIFIVIENKLLRRMFGHEKRESENKRGKE
jgi:hypothetical protein